MGDSFLDIVYIMQPTQPQDSEAPIARQSLHELVSSRVRDMVIEGRLAPGDQVNESRLCTELGVSRTPMREAIRTLAGEGLIVLRPGRSTVVRAFTPDEVRDMLDVIAELEGLAGRKACHSASDSEIAEIHEVHAAMMAHFRAGNRLDYYKLNQQIHSMIVSASGNAALAEMHGLLQGRMKRVRFVGHNDAENWRGAVSEHEEMMVALQARREDDLAEVLRRHIENTWRRVETAM